MGWYNKLNVKHLEKVAWHSTRWWHWCLPENEKIGVEPIFIDKM